MTDWTAHAARLAEELTKSGKLWSAPWQAAVRAVPRHELVPVHYVREPGTGQWMRSSTKDDLDLVYSNTALFVMPDGLSSTSMPALMTRMLEALDVHDGHDVLEIGAGTGYNAALLSHRLGDNHVFAVDIEPSLIRLAQERLARLGYQPTLITADGANGLPQHRPYDRIVATCSVPAVPWAWVEQTRDNGLILADVKPAQLAGNLVLLRRTPDGAQGRFDCTYGGFMAMRRAGETYSSPRPGPVRDRTTARSRRSTLEVIRPWEHSVLWFLAQFRLPAGISFGQCGKDTSRPPTTTFLSAADGSWCEIDEPASDGACQAWEAGPRALWRIVEDAHATWLRMGQPGVGTLRADGATDTAVGVAGLPRQRADVGPGPPANLTSRTAPATPRRAQSGIHVAVIHGVAARFDPVAAEHVHNDELLTGHLSLRRPTRHGRSKIMV